MTTEHSWTIAEGESNGVPVFVRLRDDVQPQAESGRYLSWVRITWKYEADDEYGLPSDEELDEMSDFEEVLEESLEAGNHAVMVFVMTHAGVRQWLFYTSDIHKTTQRFEALPKSLDDHLELSSDNDAEWKEYRSLAARIGAEEE